MVGRVDGWCGGWLVWWMVGVVDGWWGVWLVEWMVGVVDGWCGGWLVWWMVGGFDVLGWEGLVDLRVCEERSGWVVCGQR